MSLIDLSQYQNTIAIIAAAGIGSRMESATPKQYLKIDRQTILDITLGKFLDHPSIGLVILVISAEDIYFKHLERINDQKLVIIEGGAERVDSVNNALNFLSDSDLPDDVGIMVHDAARPCITSEDLDKLEKVFKSSRNPCVLVSPIVDTLQKIDDNNVIIEKTDRRHIVRALTPQMAKFIDLKSSLAEAILQKKFVTDEASALHDNGFKVSIVMGRSDNIKLTYPEDIELVEFYLQRQNNINKQKLE